MSSAGVLALGGVVAFELGLAAYRRGGDGVVDAEHGDGGGEGDDQGHPDGGGAEADEPTLGVETQEPADAGQEGDEAQQDGGEEGHEEPPGPPGDLPVEETGGQHGRHLGRIVEPAQAVEEAAGAVGSGQLGEDLAHHVVAERGVDGGARVDEAVVGVVLVAVHHPDLLGPRLGLQDQVEGEGDIGGAGGGDDGLDDVAVPGDLAVVVARQHHEVAGRGTVHPGAQGGAELGVGLQDGPDVRVVAGEELETVAGDDHRAAALPRTEDLDEGSRGGRRSVGHGRPEVEVGDDHDPTVAGDLDLDLVGHQVVLGDLPLVERLVDRLQRGPGRVARSAFGTQDREQDHVADGGGTGHQHHQSVDADPDATGGGSPSSRAARNSMSAG